MRQRRRVALASAVLAALVTRAAADPVPELTKYVHLESSAHVVTHGGSTIDLPPGYFYDEPTHDALERNVKDLQDTKTRLTAENGSMRKSLDGWQPGFYTLLTFAASGLALGVYVGRKL